MKMGTIMTRTDGRMITSEVFHVESSSVSTVDRK